jgi:orotidine-5'-phosphate decarboxylase
MPFKTKHCQNIKTKGKIMATEIRNFRAMLEEKWAEGKFVSVGIDPDMDKIPDCVKQEAKKRIIPGSVSFGPIVVAFCRAIIEKTRNLVCAYKPNSAFFEAEGPEGMWTLAEVVRLIRLLAPDVPVILDQKRADIGNTNRGYAAGAFDALTADAITVNPYFGGGSLAPFLDYENKGAKVAKGDKGVIVLCRTSNPEAKEVQDRRVLLSTADFKSSLTGFGKVPAYLIPSWKECVGLELPNGLYAVPLYQFVAMLVANQWNTNGNCALVVGATVPQELTEVRALVGDMPLLIPGIGFQQKGVSIEQQVELAVRAGRNSLKTGFVINDSRGTLYASAGEDFAEAARTRVQLLNELVQQYRG